ncbi:unnamed protein product [Menidia menidia]|uniref:(Atlantic silverside) hypothetical protein n=1 Tax=Menidia menidia TaxID=238744 RepID=A0A8S4ALQ3_9TELE|nr:unnamed protein product [Menidia menidia]
MGGLGRHSYRTGQDIENCGTCRDCACIIYSCVCIALSSRILSAVEVFLVFYGCHSAPCDGRMQH